MLRVTGGQLWQGSSGIRDTSIFCRQGTISDAGNLSLGQLTSRLYECGNLLDDHTTGVLQKLLVCKEVARQLKLAVPHNLSDPRVGSLATKNCLMKVLGGMSMNSTLGSCALVRCFRMRLRAFSVSRQRTYGDASLASSWTTAWGDVAKRMHGIRGVSQAMFRSGHPRICLETAD